MSRPSETAHSKEVWGILKETQKLLKETQNI